MEPPTPPAPTGPSASWPPGSLARYAPQIAQAANLQASAYPTLGGINVWSGNRPSTAERERAGPGWGTGPGLPRARKNLVPVVPPVDPITGVIAGVSAAIAGISAVSNAIQQGHYRQDTSRAQEELTNLYKQLEEGIASAREAGTLAPEDLQAAYDTAENSWNGLQKFLAEKGSAGQAGLKTMQWVPQWLGDLKSGMVSTDNPPPGGEGGGEEAKPPWWAAAVGAIGVGLGVETLGGGGRSPGAGGTAKPLPGGDTGTGEKAPWWEGALDAGAGALGGALKARAEQLPGWVEDNLRYWMKRRRDQEELATEEYSGSIDPNTGEYIPGSRQRAGAAYEQLGQQPGYLPEEIKYMFYSEPERLAQFLSGREIGDINLTREDIENQKYADWEGRGLRYADWEAEGTRRTGEEQKSTEFTGPESESFRFAKPEEAGMRYTPEQESKLRISPKEEAGIISTTLAPIAGSANRGRDQLQRLSSARGTSAYGANINRVEEEAGRQSAEAARNARLGIAEMRREGERDIAQQGIYATETAGRQRIAASGTTAAQRITASEAAISDRIAGNQRVAEQRIAGTRDVAQQRILAERAGAEHRTDTAGDVANQRLQATQNILNQRIGGYQGLGQARIAGTLASTQGLERLGSQDLDRMLLYSDQSVSRPPQTQPSSLAGAVTGTISGLTPTLADWRRPRQPKNTTVTVPNASDLLWPRRP